MSLWTAGITRSVILGYKTRLVKWFLKKIGVTPEHLEQVRVLWEHNAGKTMFFGKLSYGIASSFIVVAGMVRMPLKKVLCVGCHCCDTSVRRVARSLGYYFGNTLGGTIETVLTNIQYLIAGASLFIVAYFLFTYYMRKRTLKQEKEAEEPEEKSSNQS